MLGIRKCFAALHCNPGNRWHSGISMCSAITLTAAQEKNRKVNLLKRKPTIEMVQICRENGLTVRGQIWLSLDWKMTAFDLLLQLLYRLSFCLFSPSQSHMLYPEDIHTAGATHKSTYHHWRDKSERLKFHTSQTKWTTQGCHLSGFAHVEVWRF